MILFENYLSIRIDQMLNNHRRIQCLRKLVYCPFIDLLLQQISSKQDIQEKKNNIPRNSPPLGSDLTGKGFNLGVKVDGSTCQMQIIKTPYILHR